MDPKIARLVRALVAAQVAALEIEGTDTPRGEAERALSACLDEVQAARSEVRRFYTRPDGRTS